MENNTTTTKQAVNLQKVISMHSKIVKQVKLLNDEQRIELIDAILPTMKAYKNYTEVTKSLRAARASHNDYVEPVKAKHTVNLNRVSQSIFDQMMSASSAYKKCLSLYSSTEGAFIIAQAGKPTETLGFVDFLPKGKVIHKSQLQDVFNPKTGFRNFVKFINRRKADELRAKNKHVVVSAAERTKLAKMSKDEQEAYLSAKVENCLTPRFVISTIAQAASLSNSAFDKRLAGPTSK